MRINLKKALIILLSLSGMISFVCAGEVSKSYLSFGFEWESTACYKPTRPYIYELNEYNKWEAESYIDEIEIYILCIQNEALNDYNEAVEDLADAIEEGRDEAIRDIQNEAEAFIADISY